MPVRVWVGDLGVRVWDLRALGYLGELGVEVGGHDFEESGGGAGLVEGGGERVEEAGVEGRVEFAVARREWRRRRFHD